MKNFYIYLTTGLLVFLSLTTRSQSLLSLSVSQQTQCFSPGNNSVQVAVVNSPSAATNYTWITSGTGTCVGTAMFSGNGQNATISFPCCGVYNIYCTAVNNTITPGVPVTLTSTVVTTTVVCLPAVAASVTTSNTSCQGSSVTLYASGASNYT